jgi:hypothetical protein
MGTYTVTGQRARQMRVVPAECCAPYARTPRVDARRASPLLVLGGWLILEPRHLVLPALLPCS